MKKLLILILTLALTSVLILSACAPDEPTTSEDMLYGKPRLSKMSDEELIAVINEQGLKDLLIDLSDTRKCMADLEEDPWCYIAFSSKNFEQDLFFEYYQIDYTDFSK